jgi:hypothetical protein
MGMASGPAPHRMAASPEQVVQTAATRRKACQPHPFCVWHQQEPCRLSRQHDQSFIRSGPTCGVPQLSWASRCREQLQPRKAQCSAAGGASLPIEALVGRADPVIADFRRASTVIAFSRSSCRTKSGRYCWYRRPRSVSACPSVLSVVGNTDDQNLR